LSTFSVFYSYRYFEGQRSSISFKIASAQRTASVIAATVAGTLFPPSKLDSFLAAKIAAAMSKTRLRPHPFTAWYLIRRFFATDPLKHFSFEMVRSGQKGFSASMSGQQSHAHHYVPQWYQRRFLLPGQSRYHYLDMNPDTVVRDGSMNPLSRRTVSFYKTHRPR
jgi:hypothetical protein